MIVKTLKIMKEYWIVTENKTGKVIANCGDINDAIMMVQFDPSNRTYNRHRFLMDQVIDVSSITQGQLPGQQGLPSGTINQLTPETIKLPESQQTPVTI